jgi:tetratricopeptide (TPR) repeat protein
MPAPPAAAPTPSQVTARAATATPQGAPADAVTLRFDWNEPTGAAVFRRAGTLWVAFDKPTALDVNKLRQTAGNLIHGIEQMGTADGTVLRIATVTGINPGIRRDGLAWLLDFRKQPLEPQTPIAITAQPESPVGARLFMPVPEPGRPIGIIDPEVGDNLVIVPVIPLGHGMAAEYVYPQMNFLQTAQGVVMQPKADDIRVRPMREGVEITSVTALQISAVSAEAAARAQLGAMKPLTRVLKLEPWELKNPAHFTPRRQELLGAIAGAADDKRQQARMDLARFDFANGFNVEALAALKQAVFVRPEIEGNPEFRVLRGGAQFMLGRFEQAAADFGHDSVRANDEAIFWLAALRAAAGDLEGATPELKRTGPIIRPYPQALKTPLGAVVVETALHAGDLKQAKHFLEILTLGNLTPTERAQVDYEEGRVLAEEGMNDEAVAKWESVIAGRHRPSAAKARVARTELLLKLERITNRDAISELEKLRYAWRGDEFEFKLLRRLGQLYLEENLYREGLTALRQAATHFRTHPDAPQVTQAMSDVFSRLYLDKGADVLAPVTGLAIYEEFKELTPAGPRGDEMIRRLADRLVNVDLLDKAAGLLSSQVKFRLQGVEKARVGTQLSLIHMLAREYDTAMQVMAETELPNMPEPLNSQRRHLRAKILMEKNDRQQALNVLGADRSRDAEMLRTEIYWSVADWKNVGLTMQRLLRATNTKPGEPLSMDQASYIITYAIALTIGGNERALERIRADYGPAMAATPLKDAFALISAPPVPGLLGRDQVAGAVKQVEQFKAFLVDYRARLRKQNLSELVPSTGPLDAVTPDAWQGGKPPAPAAATPRAKTQPGTQKPATSGAKPAPPAATQPANQRPAPQADNRPNPADTRS